MSDNTGHDPQDQAEALDSDELGVDDNEEVEPEYPADHPLGVDEYGLTPAEEEVGETLEERVAREIPDPLLETLEGHDAAAVAVELAEARVDIDDVAVPAEEAALHIDDTDAIGADVFDDQVALDRDIAAEEGVAVEGDDTAPDEDGPLS